MKKIVIFVSILLAVAIISGFALPCFFEDELSKSDTTVVSTGSDNNVYCFTHTTEKGEIIECSFSINKTQLSENYSKYEFLFNANTNTVESEIHYDISQLSFIIDEGEGVSVTNAYGSSGANIYNSLTANGGKVEFSAENDYMHLTMLVHKEYPEITSNVKLRYSIEGNGLYSKNRFTGIEHNFTV